MVLFFESGTTLVEYGRLAMTGPDRPTAYRKTRTFDYRPGEKLFLTYGPNGGVGRPDGFGDVHSGDDRLGVGCRVHGARRKFLSGPYAGDVPPFRA